MIKRFPEGIENHSPVLSICICTLPGREKYLKRLMNVLLPQATAKFGLVEIITEDSPRAKDGGISTGAKRNKLYFEAARGVYVVSIDDDDLVPCYYVHEILKAADSTPAPDCITFIGHMTTDGVKEEPFEIKLGETYEQRNGVYYRFPNHIVPLKKATIDPFRFPDITLGEDSAFAYAIMGAGALKTEIHIHKNMYHYDCWNNKTY